MDGLSNSSAAAEFTPLRPTNPSIDNLFYRQRRHWPPPWSSLLAGCPRGRLSTFCRRLLCLDPRRCTSECPRVGSLSTYPVASINNNPSLCHRIGVGGEGYTIIAAVGDNFIALEQHIVKNALYSYLPTCYSPSPVAYGRLIHTPHVLFILHTLHILYWNN